ncbi:MAG: hypothetical protein NTZ33_12020 [Bacteroidetes bacterium]|nr:hypothetical protein [Bacteroidota bacterium]
MRHFKNSILIFIFAMLLSNNSKAQIINAKAEDFKEICRRPLIVQLITEDAYYVDDLQKRISKTSNEKRKAELESELLAYKEYVAGYNSLIKDAIEKVWEFNKEKPVEYKSFSDVQVLRKINPKLYTVLQLIPIKLWVTNEYGIETFTKKAIPALVYSRMENCPPNDEFFNKKFDYSFYMLYTNSRTNHKLYVSDLILSLKIIQNHIKEIRNFDKKNYTMMDYAKDQDEENCVKLKNMTLVVDEKLLDLKSKKTEIIKVYDGKLSIISSEDMSKMITNQEEEAVSVSIPFSIKSDKSGIEGMEFLELIMYMKCFINAKSGVILSSYITKSIDSFGPLFKTPEFKKIAKCK